MAEDDHHFDANNIPTIDSVVWKPDESARNCLLCEKIFDAFRRKHHCRACGEIFCKACSDKKANIIGYREAQRVCRRCDRRLSTGFHEIKQVRDSEAHDDEFLLELRAIPGNDCCVDCGTATDATWVSISLGTIICLKCAGIHREFGVTVSFVQSLTLDTLKREHQAALRAGGNLKFHTEVLQKLPEEVVNCSPSAKTPGDSAAAAKGYTYSQNPDRFYAVYHSRAAELYRRQLQARATGQPVPTEIEASYVERRTSPRNSPEAIGTPREWAQDSEHCMHCEQKFTVARRRHHCRMCGLCLCDDCSPADNTRPVLIDGKMINARVCLRCFNPPSRATSTKSARVSGGTPTASEGGSNSRMQGIGSSSASPANKPDAPNRGIQSRESREASPKESLQTQAVPLLL